MEAAFYYVLKAKHVARFIENNIICRYGIPQEIIIDSGSHFEGEVQRIMKLYNIECHKSSPYRPQTNGAVEVANKNIKNILAKMGGGGDIQGLGWKTSICFMGLQNFYPCIN